MAAADHGVQQDRDRTNEEKDASGYLFRSHSGRRKR